MHQKISVQDKDAELAGKIVTQIAEIAPNIIVEAVEAGSCKVISEVEVGDRPVSPDKARYTALFAFLGLIVSSGIVISREIFSNYVVDDVDVGKKIGLPVLGVIPQVEEIFITCVALIADILTSSANYALETVNPRLLITLFKTILLFMMIA